MSTAAGTTSVTAMIHHPMSDSSSSYCDSPHVRKTLDYCDSPHVRQTSRLSDVSSYCESPHARQHSGLSGQSYSDVSFTWTGSSRHSRQSSHVSSSSGLHDSFTMSGPHHQRYSSRDSGHSYDNRGYDTSPLVSRTRRQPHHSHPSSSSHSRQSSYDHPHQPPAVNIDPSRPYHGHVSCISPTPPAFKISGHYNKYSPVSQDQGYHTMVGPQSSPDISPGASMDLTSLSLTCPSGSTRPRPPDVPDVRLDPRNIIASFRKNTSSSRMGLFEMLTDDIILRIMSHMDSVTKVRLGQVSRRFYLLAWDPVLWTCLNLTGDNLDTDLAVRSILACLTRDCGGKSGRYTHVSRVNLTYCTRLSDAGLGVIARTCPGLTTLEIRSCKLVTNTGVAEIVTRCSKLHHLDITGMLSQTVNHFVLACENI